MEILLRLLSLVLVHVREFLEQCEMCTRVLLCQETVGKLSFAV